MFDGFLEDLPVGKIVFQHGTEVFDATWNLISIRKKLEEEYIYNRKCMQILEELELYLNEDKITEKIECKLNPKGNHFFNTDEEQYYNHIVNQYNNIISGLNILGLEYKTEASSIAENQHGEKIIGPNRLEPIQNVANKFLAP